MRNQGDKEEDAFFVISQAFDAPEQLVGSERRGIGSMRLRGGTGFLQKALDAGGYDILQPFQKGFQSLVDLHLQGHGPKFSQ
jgi:hypothetical protein